MNARFRRLVWNGRFLHLPLVAAVFGLGGLVVIAALPQTRADEEHRHFVYNSNGFEPRPFVAGEPLAGIDGWLTGLAPFLNPEAAVITDADSAGGRQSVAVWGGDLVGSDGITDPYEAVGSYRRPVNHTVLPHKPVVVVSADLLLDTESLGTEDDFFSLTIAVRSGNGETLGEMGLSSSGSAVAYGFNAPPGATPEFTAPIAFNKWQQVSIAVDYSDVTPLTSYYLNGKLLGTISAPTESDVVARGSMVVQALPDTAGDARADYTARFDNFQITAHALRD
jgi:hypothetical protein